MTERVLMCGNEALAEAAITMVTGDWSTFGGFNHLAAAISCNPTGRRTLSIAEEDKIARINLPTAEAFT